MPSPETIDFAALLPPIPGDNPAGQFIRYAGPYDAIEQARRSDDGLQQGDWAREEKKADWAGVVAIATETLSTKSKDLQIAAWLAEALVKRQGFAGLRDGLRLVRELQEQFWESAFPLLEDGDLSFRAGPLQWLNAKLPDAIKRVALTRGEPGYSFLHWDEARQVDNLARQNPEAGAAAVAEGKMTGEQFNQGVGAAPRAFYEALFGDLRQASEEFEKLDRLVDERFGREAPSLSDLKGALAECHELVEGIVKKKRELEPDAVAADGEEFPAAAGGGPVVGGGSLPLEPVSRADALRRLAAVAAFFRRTEPHSPISYIVERAIRWGEMPLERWLEDVIRSDDVLGHLRETLGIKEPTGA